jgi:cytochrome c553
LIAEARCEHTDFSTQIPQSVNTGTAGAPVWASTGVMVPGPLATFSAPHTSAQADVFFGFNAYFGPRLAPSAHMAVANSCAGCHAETPTARQVAAGETSNHSFVADGTICARCHGSGVDGQALQAANRMQLDQLRNLWASKLLTNLNEPAARAVRGVRGRAGLPGGQGSGAGALCAAAVSPLSVARGDVAEGMAAT